MNPHTTDGMTARNSITILNVSLNVGEQNSDTKIAAPSPNGTAINIAKDVTLNVPKINAKVPYLLLFSDVGYHSSLLKNSQRFNPLNRKLAPSLNTKKKIQKTNRIELIPQSRMKSSMTVSENGRLVALFGCIRIKFYLLKSIVFICKFAVAINSSLKAQTQVFQQFFDHPQIKSNQGILLLLHLAPQVNTCIMVVR